MSLCRCTSGSNCARLTLACLCVTTSGSNCARLTLACLGVTGLAFPNRVNSSDANAGWVIMHNPQKVACSLCGVSLGVFDVSTDS